MSFNLNPPDALTVTDESQSPARLHHLAVWRHRRDSDFAPLWKAASDGRGALAGFFIRRENILADARLTDPAKQTDIREAALAAARELGDAQRLVNEARQRTHAERLELADVEAATAADAIVDIEIARHFNALGDKDRSAFLQALVSGSEPRAVEAVLRLPAFLVGLSPEMRAVIAAGAVERAHPTEVGRLRELDEAAATAQHALKRAAEILSQSVALELAELMRAFGGDGWQHFIEGPRPALEALARHYRVEAQPA